MTSIFRDEVRGSLAVGFVDQYQQDSAAFISNRLYCALADTRGTDLSGDVLDTDDYQPWQSPGAQELGFWYDPTNGGAGEGIIGMQKVDENKIVAAIPRENKDWAGSTAYVEGDYVIAVNGTGQVDVFLCVAAGTSTTQPEYTSGLTVDTAYFDDGLESIIADGGSLRWKYLFRLPTVMVDELLDDEWCPVPYGSNIGADSGNGDVDEARSDAAQILNAHHVIIKAILLSDNGGVNLPDSGSYSKVALIKNPIQSDNTSLCTATSYLAATLSNDGVNPFPSGDMIYLSHRGPITRQSNQTEDVKVVLAL